MRAQHISFIAMKRRAGESVIINVTTEQHITEPDENSIEVVIKEIHKSYVKLVIIGPRRYPIVRRETIAAAPLLAKPIEEAEHE